MKDFRLLASGEGLHLLEEELARICAVLAGLEAGFRPLVETIPLETEPAVSFACPREERP